MMPKSQLSQMSFWAHECHTRPCQQSHPYNGTFPCGAQAPLAPQLCIFKKAECPSVWMLGKRPPVARTAPAAAATFWPLCNYLGLQRWTVFWYSHGSFAKTGQVLGPESRRYGPMEKPEAWSCLHPNRRRRWCWRLHRTTTTRSSIGGAICLPTHCIDRWWHRACTNLFQTQLVGNWSFKSAWTKIGTHEIPRWPAIGEACVFYNCEFLPEPSVLMVDRVNELSHCDCPWLALDFINLELFAHGRDPRYPMGKADWFAEGSLWFTSGGPGGPANSSQALFQCPPSDSGQIDRSLMTFPNFSQDFGWSQRCFQFGKTSNDSNDLFYIPQISTRHQHRQRQVHTVVIWKRRSCACFFLGREKLILVKRKLGCRDGQNGPSGHTSSRPGLPGAS